jgi:putative spermidine/putrescine transport system permease protein
MTAIDLPAGEERARADGRLRQFRAAILALPATVILLGVFAIPLVVLAASSLHEVDDFNLPTPGISFAQYASLVDDPRLREALWRTPLFALEVTVLTMVIAYVAASAIQRTTSPALRTVMYLVVLSPLLTSVIVRTYGWVIVLSQNGLVNRALEGSGLTDGPVKILYTYGATLTGTVHVMVPFAVLPIVAALNRNESLIRAASVMGASGARTFWRVTMPMISPGLAAGATLVYVLTMGTYITPIVLGGSSGSYLATLVYSEVLQLHNVPRSAALSLVLIAWTALLVVPSNWLYARWRRRRFEA